MNILNLVLLAPCLLPAIPLKRLRALPILKILPKPVPEIVVSILGGVPLALVGTPWLALVAVTGLAATFFSGEAVGRVLSYLRGEAKVVPAAVSKPLEARQRGIWIGRVAIALLTAASLLCLTFGLDITPFIAGPIVFIALGSSWLASDSVSRRQQWSDRIHATELERLLSWAHKTGSTALIHVPDGDAATLKALAALRKELAAEGVKPALICRGRKAYAKFRTTTTEAWLCRTVRDLDDYAAPPFMRCYHMNRGTNGSHIIALLRVRHTLVDLEHVLPGLSTLPKPWRMFDEILADAGISPELREDAARYGITIRQKASVKPPMIMPSLPLGLKPCFGLVVPADAAGHVELAGLEPAFEVLTNLYKAYPDGFRVLLAFEAASAATMKSVKSWLSHSIGDVLHSAKTAQDALNSAPVLIWTSALDRLLLPYAKRAIIRSPEDIEAHRFPTPLPAVSAYMVDGENTCCSA